VKLLENDYKCSINEAKKSPLEEFISKIENPSDTSSLLKSLGKRFFQEIGFLKNQNGIYSSSPVPIPYGKALSKFYHL